MKFHLTISPYCNFFLLLFREEDKKLLDMPHAGQLRAHFNRKNFPGRGFNNLYCRYHFLRMKLTSPKEYIAHIQVSKKSTSIVDRIV